MPEESVAEREVKDFRFHLAAKVRVDKGFGLVQQRTSLVASTNLYGLTFVGTATGVNVYKSSQLHDLAKLRDTVDVVTSLNPWNTVSTEAQPSNISVNADSLILAIVVQKANGSFLQLYDMQDVAKTNSDIKSYMEVRLGNIANTVVNHLQWNPSTDYAGIFGACVSDGSFILCDVSSRKTVMQSLAATNGITCVCWSARGKQLVIGTRKGTLVQMDHSLTPRRIIPLPALFNTSPMRGIAIRGTY